jgi:hypothetical protein
MAVRRSGNPDHWARHNALPWIACLDRLLGSLAWAQQRTYISPRPRQARALRLAVQDAALSRRKHGFDSRRARHFRTPCEASSRSAACRWASANFRAPGEEILPRGNPPRVTPRSDLEDGWALLRRIVSKTREDYSRKGPLGARPSHPALPSAHGSSPSSRGTNTPRDTFAVSGESPTRGSA